MRAILALAFLMLLALQSASVAAADTEDSAPLRILTAPLHVGDRLAYHLSASERVTDSDGNDMSDVWHGIPYRGETTTTVTIQGRATAVDEYGIPRDAVAFLIERAQAGKVVSRERCYQMPPIGLAVRTDWLEGGPTQANEWNYYSPNVPLLGEGTRWYNTTPIALYRANACDGYWDPNRADHVEGQASGHPGETTTYWTTLPWMGWATESEPAVATTFRGSPALSYLYPLREYDGSGMMDVEGAMRVVLAEGYPGPVEIEMHVNRTSEHESREQHALLRLVGYAPGTEPFPYDMPYELIPDRNPSATFTRQDPMLLPDEALDLPYPFAEALGNARADPRLSLGRFLNEHPQARLAYAEYEDPMESTYGRIGSVLAERAVVSGPGWRMCYADSSQMQCAVTILPADGAAVTSGTELSRRAPYNEESDRYDQGWDVPTAPYEAASADDVGRLLAQAGIERGTVKSVSFSASRSPHDGQVRSGLHVSQVPWATLTEGVGRLTWMDLQHAGLREVTATSATIHRSGILATPATAPPDFEPAAAGASTSAPGPFGFASTTPSAVVVATAAGGVTLFALLVKFLLLPLYSRLMRDRLLDNPVRARLYERVRAEPGLHLAELVDFAGIGKGATKHHLDQLVAHRYLVETRVGEFLRYYAAGEVPPDVARRAAVLRAGSHERVYELYAANPGMSLRQAAATLGMSAPSVHRAKKRLQNEGLLPPAEEPARRA